MKILTISTRKENFYLLPQEEQKKLLIGLVEHMIKLKEKMGDKLLMYSIPAWGRAMTIGEYSSFEEYSQSLQTPVSQRGFSSHESYPLIESSIEEYKAYLKQVQATG
jgi:hypothetical protein